MRKWLYSENENKIFEGEENIKEALESGEWFEKPVKKVAPTSNVVEGEITGKKIEVKEKTLSDFTDNELIEECINRGILEPEDETELKPLSAFKDKNSLEEYGKTLGIDLNRTKTKENMYKDLVDFVTK